MRGLAGIVAAVIDELGLGEVDILGYSFGGGLAQELAYRFPERVRRLVLCATTHGLLGVPPRPVPALLLATPARDYHPLLFRLTVPRIAGGHTRRDPTQLDLQAPPSSSARQTRSTTPSSSTRCPAGRAFRGFTG
jgi:pimeloyl-ACP methyl ester carboxylesterase